MHKKKYIILITLVIISFAGFMYSSLNVFTSMKTIDQVIRYIRDYYVNPVKCEDLLDNAIEGIINNLDVHTSYLNEHDYNDLMIKTKGKFGGLGIQISKRGDYITIISPIEDTPAFRAGLLQGDKITAIENKSTKEMKLNRAVSLMRGKPGTDVTITIKREGVENPVDYKITRDIIKIKSVPYSAIVGKNTGYIRINSFNEETSKDVRNSLDSLINLGVLKFILDLRGNPGGVLEQANKTASLFIEKGKQIVYTEGNSVYDSYSSTNGNYKDYPLVVLVDGYSASGSEILAGAVQDWDKGYLLGTKTFGKGSVQRLYPLSNNKAIKLTIARYHTPSGRCIDKELVTDTTKVFHTRGPLNREVRGGGGIIPDSILTYETSELYHKILRHNIDFNFIVSYTSENKDIEHVTDDMVEKYKEKIIEKGVEFTEEEWEETLPEVIRGLKIGIAYNKKGTKGRYEAIIPEDRHIKTAIDILSRVVVPADLFALNH